MSWLLPPITGCQGLHSWLWDPWHEVPFTAASYDHASGGRRPSRLSGSPHLLPHSGRQAEARQAGRLRIILEEDVGQERQAGAELLRWVA